MVASSRASDERRYSRRTLEPPLPASLHVVGSPPRQMQVDVLDISEGGACLAMAPPRILGRGDRAALLIGTEARTVHVRWVSPDHVMVVVGVSYTPPPA